MSNGAQAQHERNVLLRNDGQGGFDEVSGSVGLDLDQDGRSFAVFDYDLDGDPDLVVMAPRSSPQLRLFRNDYDGGNAAIAVRLVGTRSNRDAVGARVTIETDQLRRTKIVQIGSGFLSQSSKELLFGLGKSQRVLKATVVWPGGATESLGELPLNQRSWVEEGKGVVRSEPFRKKSRASAPPPALPAGNAAPLPSGGTWLYEPFPAPDFALRDLDGEERSLSGLRGRPALILFWATWAAPSRQALEELARAKRALTDAGAAVLALAVDPPADEGKVKAAGKGLGLPVMVAGEETAGAYDVLNRYLFDRREDMRLPTVFLVNAKGEVVKVYREPIAASPILEDLPRIEASSGERLARAVPFAGTFSSSPGPRNYFQYGLELSEQGYDAAALVAFQSVVKSDPSAMTLYNLGTLYMRLGQSVVAKGAFEHALELQADYPEASNTLGALLAQNGDVPGAIVRFRAALKTKPEYPDALNNLGYALFQAGQAKEAHDLYLTALKLQPDRRRSTTWASSSAGPGTSRARRRISRRRWRIAPVTGRPPTTWPWCSRPGAMPRARSSCFSGSWSRNPDSRWPT